MAELEQHNNPKLALLCYAQAVAYNPTPRLFQKVAKRILALRNTTTYGPVCTARELASIPDELVPHLLRPFPTALRQHLAQHLWTYSSPSRDRQHYLGVKQLPRFFTWLYPDHIAAMSTPLISADVETLQAMGITHVLTLTQEGPLPATWFSFRSITNIFIPIANYSTPTLQEMDCVYQRVTEGGVWLVHCGGGKGRAGTVLACLVAMLGTGDESPTTSTPQMGAATAVTMCRSMRPGSLESVQQETFVSEWVSHRWR